MPKNPLYADVIVLANGGRIETQDGTDIVTVDSSGDVTVASDSETWGDSMADTQILNSRISTGSVAGSALTVDATYTRGEAQEYRYNVTSWSGIPAIDTIQEFKAAYWRSESAVDDAQGLLMGGEGWGVANGCGVYALEGLRGWAYPKGDTTDTIDRAYGLRGEFSMDAARVNTLTITTEAAGVLSRVTSGVVADYTKIHAFVGRLGDMDGGSRTYGSGLRLLDGAESGTSALTSVIYTDMAATYFLQTSGATGAVDTTIAGQTVGTINCVVKCRFASTDFFLYGYAAKPTS